MDKTQHDDRLEGAESNEEECGVIALEIRLDTLQKCIANCPNTKADIKSATTARKVVLRNNVEYTTRSTQTSKAETTNVGRYTVQQNPWKRKLEVVTDNHPG